MVRFKIDYENMSEEEIDRLEQLRQEMLDHPFGKIDIRRLPSGVPETYYCAIAEWKYFVDYYANYYAPDAYPYIVFALDTILDIAPKINDKKTMQQVLSDIQKINFEQYDKRLIWAIFNMAGSILRFRKNCITSSPAKQKDLVEMFASYIPLGTPPQFSDGTWYIYVWRQFGIVKVEKKGRYNYVSLP